MEALFLKIVNMSLSACIIAAAALLLRFALKKAPKWVRCLLWALVAVRLVCPFSIESRLSAVPESIGDGSLVSSWSESYDTPAVTMPASAPQYSGAAAPQSPEAAPESREDASAEAPAAKRSAVPVLARIWLCGAAAMLAYALISWLRLKRRVGEAARAEGSVWLSDKIDSPFILGIFRPRIYVPAELGKEQTEQVLAHERAHLARRDHWWKPLGFLLLAVYWFNPLLWLAYILLCRDIELACDEKVIRALDAEEKRAYAETLLECSLPRFAVAACPLAFGEVGIKERIRAVVNYKKPAFWIIIAALCACAALAVCLLTNPKAPHIKLARGEITGAAAFHLENVEKDGVYELSAAETDELAERVNALRGLSKEDAYAGLTPLYTVQVSTRDGGYLHIRGYGTDGEKTDISYKGKVYRVEDEDFQAYVLRLCDAAQRVEAEKADAANQPENTAAGPTVAEIIDRSVTEGIATAQATELFWETDGQEFYFPSVKSHLIIVKLTNGEELPVKEALEKGIVTLYDLSKSGIEFYGVRKELIKPQDYNIEFIDEESLGKLPELNTEALCVYYLNADGAFAEGAAAELGARRAQDSQSVDRAIERLAEKYPENAEAIRRLLYQAIEAEEAAGNEAPAATQYYDEDINRDAVIVMLRPTGRIDIDGYGYYVPQNQDEWKAAWDEAAAAEHEWDRIATAEPSGMVVRRGEEYMTFYTDGSFGIFGMNARRVDAGDGAALAELMRSTGEYFKIAPVYPQQLKGIKRASLYVSGFIEEFHETTDPQTLAKIEDMLSNAESFGGMSGCWFTSLLTLELESGEEYTISIATDSCGCYLSDGLVFRFAHGNLEFYDLFGVKLEY